MAIYHVSTPKGDRLIEAKTKAGAINQAMRTECKAEALTAVQLANYLRQNPEAVIEQSETEE